MNTWKFIYIGLTGDKQSRTLGLPNFHATQPRIPTHPNPFRSRFVPLPPVDTVYFNQRHVYVNNLI